VSVCVFRWNSTFYMLNHLIEQKKPLILYTADNDIALPTSHQWTLLARALGILSPIERATRDVSADASLASDVVPMVVAIKRALQRITDDSGVQTMKKEMLAEIDSRFGHITKEPLYAIATLVDPRYRGKLFSDRELDEPTKRVTELVEQLATTTMTSRVASEPDSEPVVKRARLDDVSPLDLLDADLQADAVRPESSAADEVADFLRQTNITRQQDPLEWWKLHEKGYPRVADVAKRYLSAPSTSVPSERLFSSAGDLYADSRSRLSGRLAHMLLFIKHNLKFI